MVGVVQFSCPGWQQSSEAHIKAKIQHNHDVAGIITVTGVNARPGWAIVYYESPEAARESVEYFQSVMRHAYTTKIMTPGQAGVLLAAAGPPQDLVPSSEPPMFCPRCRSRGFGGFCSRCGSCMAKR